MYPIITAEELKQILTTPHLLIFDARATKTAEEDYGNSHLKDATFVSLEKDLAEIHEDPTNGGRHPMPTVEVFRKTLENFGVREDSHIVVYDDKNGANAAARCWWMLKSFGLEKVQVLSGGIQEAEKHGLAMTAEVKTLSKSHLAERKSWKFPMVDIGIVEEGLNTGTATVIDVRDAYRYKGESEPIDLVAGHIPGAINIPFSENLDASGNFLSKEILQEKYQQLLKDLPQRRIVHCGSGVTACHTILALVAAGFKIPELYVGSWSEWSRRKSGEDIATC